MQITVSLHFFVRYVTYCIMSTACRNRLLHIIIVVSDQIQACDNTFCFHFSDYSIDCLSVLWANLLNILTFLFFFDEWYVGCWTKNAWIIRLAEFRWHTTENAAHCMFMIAQCAWNLFFCCHSRWADVYEKGFSFDFIASACVLRWSVIDRWCFLSAVERRLTWIYWLSCQKKSLID